jgi:hypothetical protein
MCVIKQWLVPSITLGYDCVGDRKKCFKGHFCGAAEYEIQQVCELIRVW